jgi:hypothetical protein
MTPDLLGSFLLGYILTVVIEAAILVVCLSTRHPLRVRLFAAPWLTGCTYPVVHFILPFVMSFSSRLAFLAVAETFAPVAECILFWLAFGVRTELRRYTMWRDCAAITIANVLSFGAGEILYRLGML